MTRREGIRIGGLMVLAQPDHQTLAQYGQRLVRQSYQRRETEHFTLCRHPSTGQVILLHAFRPEEAHADLISFIESELLPSGLISSAREFGAILFAVLASMYPAPRDQHAIWLHFCRTSLEALRDRIAHPAERVPRVSHVEAFAAIYRRLFDLVTGDSFLDVGCSFGFFPVLVAERHQAMRVVACDISADAITLSRALAEATQAHQVEFHQRDVLSEAFSQLGQFDTVTAIHLLEHLKEEDLPIALHQLLQVTRKRLLLAVPFEEHPKAVYGHVQVFSLEKLHHWGKWCLELIGHGRYWCEEVMGGLLILERGSLPERA